MRALKKNYKNDNDVKCFDKVLYFLCVGVVFVCSNAANMLENVRYLKKKYYQSTFTLQDNYYYTISSSENLLI